MDDPRFHLGLAHFNAGEFFNAHEVWEELWHDCPAIDRRFVQSLIQAAVAIYHWGNGNAAGARTLLARGRAKAADYPPVHSGLPLADFWKAVEATVLADAPPPVLELRSEPPLPDREPPMPRDADDLEGFAGVARLFPLPDLVLFPGIDQGLHIFEHRYRQMTADAIADDGRIALVMLAPNWEEQYDARPAIEAVACLGRIVAHEKLEDGRYNLRLRGVARLRIETELCEPAKMYRLARCAVLADIPPADLAEATGFRAELRAAVLSRFPVGGQAHKQIVALFDSELPLGEVCDRLAYSLPLPCELKQHLLAEPAATVRAEILTHALRCPPRKNRPFPPDFSQN